MSLLQKIHNQRSGAAVPHGRSSGHTLSSAECCLCPCSARGGSTLLETRLLFFFFEPPGPPPESPPLWISFRTCAQCTGRVQRHDPQNVRAFGGRKRQWPSERV